MLEIDGSYGEGGGQILRTALGLSCFFNKSFRMFNIRQGRKKPGLMPQHVTAVRAAQFLSNAEVKGDQAGSTELLFSPRKARGGDFSFDIGTAGSTLLVLQTLIPDLMKAKDNTTVTLKGGTHVPFSPSFHYVREVFVPYMKGLGAELTLSIESYGFYPKGGGRISAEISPVKELRPLNVAERGVVTGLKGYSCVGNLPLSIAERQRKALIEKLHSEIPDLRCPVDIETMNVPTPGQGTFIFLCSVSEHSVAGFTALGERGKRAEAVGEEAAMEFARYYATGAALDPHMADQIVLYLSLCREESVFTTSEITRHLSTNLWVAKLFHEFRYEVKGGVGGTGTIRIRGN